jgi:hypothetical protein
MQIVFGAVTIILTLYRIDGRRPLGISFMPSDPEPAEGFPAKYVTVTNIDMGLLGYELGMETGDFFVSNDYGEFVTRDSTTSFLSVCLLRQY